MFRVRRALQRWALSGLMQVELVGDLGCDELHGRALDRLGDGFRISESFFCPFE
jgi:hypothetical protein